MKTLFVSAFEGIEAKNIMRTSVLPVLLRDPDVRLVFLMKSAERAAYYAKEFSDPRIIYDVAPYDRSWGSGIDRLFAQLKFLLLRTDTTIRRRRMAYEAEGNRVRFLAGLFASFILARRPVRRLIRALDYLMVRNTDYHALFDRYRPDAVFLAHLFEEPEIHVLREARRRKILTVGFVNSWDKVTARCIMRLLPDYMIVFNDIVRDEMIVYNDFPSEKIFVAGIPQYDSYFTHPGPYHSREEFFERIGARHVPKKLIVYAPMGRTFSNVDWDVLDMLHEHHARGDFGSDTLLLIRFQPNDFIDESELATRPWAVYDYPGVRFTAKRGVDWDMNTGDLMHLHDTLYYADVVVSWAGSFGVDAAIFGKPVVHPDVPLRMEALRINSPREHYRFTHYEKAIATGAFHLAESEDGLVRAIADRLVNPSLDLPGRVRLIEQEVQFTDGRSGERIARRVLDLMKRVSP